MMVRKRVAFVLRNGDFDEILFKQLRKGDVFRLVDEGPDPAETGVRLYMASGNPYQTERGTYSVRAETVVRGETEDRKGCSNV